MSQASQPTREALKSLARALARAAAIQDYERQNAGQADGGYDESGDLRSVLVRQTDRKIN